MKWAGCEVAGMGSLGRGVGWSGDWRHGREARRDQATSGGTKEGPGAGGPKGESKTERYFIGAPPITSQPQPSDGGLLERELHPTFKWMRQGDKEKKRVQAAEQGTSE